MNSFDITIVGGGLVGASLACALAKNDWQCALIDAAPEHLRPTSQTRYIGLNEASVCFFKNIGVWSKLAPFATPIKQVHVSHRAHFGKVKLTAAECGVEALGHVVAADVMQAALYVEMASQKNIQLLQPAILQAIQENDTGVLLQVSQGDRIFALTSRWAVAADGSHSSVRQLLNVPAETIDYQQSALVTMTTLKRHHQFIAYERFLPTGAIAMLPLLANTVATIWTGLHADIDKLMGLADTQFLATLQAHMGHRLGAFCAIGKRGQFPLQRMTVNCPQKKHILLMGNAAHTQHPIAAQGLNLSLYEIAILAENLSRPTPVFTIEGALSSRQQFFSQHLSHHLQGLFAQDFLPINWARQLGMVALESCLPLKNYFTRAAMGRAGHVPWLMMSEKN